MKMHAGHLAGALILLAGVSAQAVAGSDFGNAMQQSPLIEETAQQPVTLPADKGRFWAVSYTLGHNFGQRLRADIAELDLAAFQDGLRESFNGNAPQLTSEQMMLAINEYNDFRNEQMRAEQEKLAATNLAEANAFLAKNGKRKGVKTTKTGLQYEVMEAAKGPSPKATDVVRAHYHGTLVDGTVFDSSRDAEPVDFPLNRVIPGWTEGLQLMAKGSKFRFWVPPALAYGARGVQDAIGPNQVLVFEVNLIDFHAAPAPKPAAEEVPPAEAAPVEEAAP